MCLVGCVWFARHCDEMHSGHLFPTVDWSPVIPELWFSLLPINLLLYDKLRIFLFPLHHHIIFESFKLFVIVSLEFMLMLCNILCGPLKCGGYVDTETVLYCLNISENRNTSLFINSHLNTPIDQWARTPVAWFQFFYDNNLPIIIWLCLTWIGNYQIHECDWLKWILTARSRFSYLKRHLDR